jgi:hypothetical protein
MKKISVLLAVITFLLVPGNYVWAKIEKWSGPTCNSLLQ